MDYTTTDGSSGPMLAERADLLLPQRAVSHRSQTLRALSLSELVKSSQWKFVPPPLDSVLLWAHCAGDMGYESFIEVAKICDTTLTFAYMTDEKVIAVVTMSWVKVGWSGSFSFWLGPAYHRMHPASFGVMVDQLKECLKATTTVKILYTQCATRLQRNTAERFGGRRVGQIYHLYGPWLDGVFYQWDLR